MQFRIEKTTRSIDFNGEGIGQCDAYRLYRKLPAELMNGKEEWDLVRGLFETHLEAKAFAYQMAMPEGSNIVEEFEV